MASTRSEGQKFITPCSSRPTLGVWSSVVLQGMSVLSDLRSGSLERCITLLSVKLLAESSDATDSTGG
jgi:hypothetical protein